MDERSVVPTGLAFGFGAALVPGIEMPGYYLTPLTGLKNGPLPSLGIHMCLIENEVPKGRPKIAPEFIPGLGGRRESMSSVL